MMDVCISYKYLRVYILDDQSFHGRFMSLVQLQSWCMDGTTSNIIRA